jgi:hypothetical protein
MTLKFNSHTVTQVVSIIILIITLDRHADLSTSSPAMLATPRLKIMQQIGISYPGYDVNIVLRVGLYGWRAECPKRKQQNSRSSGVIYSRPRVLRI